MIDARRAGGRQAKKQLGAEIEAEHYEGLGDEYEARYVEEIDEFGLDVENGEEAA